MKPLIYFIGSARELKELKLRTLQLPADTIHATDISAVQGRRGSAVIFVGSTGYDVTDYVAIRDRLNTQHPDAVIIRLK